MREGIFSAQSASAKMIEEKAEAGERPTEGVHTRTFLAGRLAGVGFCCGVWFLPKKVSSCSGQVLARSLSRQHPGIPQSHAPWTFWNPEGQRLNSFRWGKEDFSKRTWGASNSRVSFVFSFEFLLKTSQQGVPGKKKKRRKKHPALAKSKPAMHRRVCIFGSWRKLNPLLGPNTYTCLWLSKPFWDPILVGR